MYVLGNCQNDFLTKSTMASYERSRRNLNFQRRAQDYEALMARLNRPGRIGPLVNLPHGHINPNARNLFYRMAIEYNKRHGTRQINSNRSFNSMRMFAANDKRTLNSNTRLHRNAGKSVKRSPTRGYVWHHPGLAAQLRGLLNRARTRAARIRRYTAALKYASNYEKAKKRWANNK